MAGVVRFGISLDKELFARFSAMITKRGWKNRSDAFGRLIREELVKEEWASGQECAGAITLIYDHHKRELVNRLMDIQHDFGALILSSQHIHLDHHNCLEVIACLLYTSPSPRD